MGTEPNCIGTHFSRTASQIGRTSQSVCTHGKANFLLANRSVGTINWKEGGGGQDLDTIGSSSSSDMMGVPIRVPSPVMDRHN